MAKRSPAPGDLALVQEFVNTADLESGEEALDSAGAWTRWLREHGLLSGQDEASDQHFRRALAVREALRGLTLANNGAPLYPVDLATLNQAAVECAIRVKFLAARTARLESEQRGPSAALGRILSAVFTAMVDGSWPRLKACRRHSCRWAFYDSSKNRSSTWCSMAVCGNRTKAETYRKRRRMPAS
jgi:predicted RNA-binding Zn ribbon-like protein